MIKFVVAAIWISLATTGALLFSFQSAQTPGEDTVAQEPNAFQGLDYVKTDVISVPLFREGRVHGYFLTRLVYTGEATRLKALKLPAQALISDQVYSFLFANPQLDFSQHDTIDLDAFREGIRVSINERVGEELIQEVLVEQMDYLPKGETQPTSIQELAPIPEPEPAAAGGH
jgi:hypothetical protein